MTRLYLGSDHGGFTAKSALGPWLVAAGQKVHDLGATRLDPQDDYPLIASLVAEQVSADPKALGILLCRSGQGVTIVANKFAGVRAILAWNAAVAKAGREDDAANILCLPADYLTEETLKQIVGAWLAASPKTDERFGRRLDEIQAIEKQNGLRVRP